MHHSHCECQWCVNDEELIFVVLLVSNHVNHRSDENFTLWFIYGG